MDGDSWGPEYWYYQAYHGAYWEAIKPQVFGELADLVYRENAIMKYLREQGERRRQNREAFKKAVKGKGWR